MPVKYTKLLGGGECVICTPLPRCNSMEIQDVELLLLDRGEIYKHTKENKDKYD